MSMKNIIIGETVINKRGKKGTITSFNDDYIYVELDGKTITFQHNAFQQGFLKYENENLQKSFDESIEKVVLEKIQKEKQRNAELDKIREQRKLVETKSRFDVEIISASVRLDPVPANFNSVRKSDKDLIQSIFRECDKDIRELYDSFVPDMQYTKNYPFKSKIKYCTGFLCKYSDTYVFRIFSRNDVYAKSRFGKITVLESDTTEILRILCAKGKVYYFSKNTSSINGYVKNTTAYNTWHISDLAGAIMLNEVIRNCDCGYLNDYIAESKVECSQYVKLLFPALYNNKAEIVFKNKLFSAVYRIDNILGYLENFTSKQIDFASKNNVLNVLPIIRHYGNLEINILQHLETIMKKRRNSNCIYDSLMRYFKQLNFDCSEIYDRLIKFLKKINYFDAGTYNDYINELAEKPNITIGDFFDKNYIDRHNIMMMEKLVEYDEAECKQYMHIAKELSWINREDEDNGYFITIPQTIYEFKQEGEMQHNCVYTCEYFKYVINCESIIVFLRKEQNTSYITIEFDYETFDVLQAYGKYNSEIDKNLYQYVVDLGKQLLFERLSQE